MTNSFSLESEKYLNLHPDYLSCSKLTIKAIDYCVEYMQNRWQKHKDENVGFNQNRTSLVLLLLIWNNFFSVRVFHRVFLTSCSPSGACLWPFQISVPVYPEDSYLFKVNNRNTRTMCEICSKLTIKIRSGFFIANF